VGYAALAEDALTKYKDPPTRDLPVSVDAWTLCAVA